MIDLIFKDKISHVLSLSALVLIGLAYFFEDTVIIQILVTILGLSLLARVSFLVFKNRKIKQQ